MTIGQASDNQLISSVQQRSKQPLRLHWKPFVETVCLAASLWFCFCNGACEAKKGRNPGSLGTRHCWNTGERFPFYPHTEVSLSPQKLENYTASENCSEQTNNHSDSFRPAVKEKWGMRMQPRFVSALGKGKSKFKFICGLFDLIHVRQRKEV